MLGPAKAETQRKLQRLAERIYFPANTFRFNPETTQGRSLNLLKVGSTLIFDSVACQLQLYLGLLQRDWMIDFYRSAKKEKCKFYSCTLSYFDKWNFFAVLLSLATTNAEKGAIWNIQSFLVANNSRSSFKSVATEIRRGNSKYICGVQFLSVKKKITVFSYWNSKCLASTGKNVI